MEQQEVLERRRWHELHDVQKAQVLQTLAQHAEVQAQQARDQAGQQHYGRLQAVAHQAAVSLVGTPERAQGYGAVAWEQMPLARRESRLADAYQWLSHPALDRSVQRIPPGERLQLRQELGREADRCMELDRARERVDMENWRQQQEKQMAR